MVPSIKKIENNRKIKMYMLSWHPLNYNFNLKKGKINGRYEKGHEQYLLSLMLIKTLLVFNFSITFRPQVIFCTKEIFPFWSYGRTFLSSVQDRMTQIVWTKVICKGLLQIKHPKE